MSISSHLGIILVLIVGLVTIFGIVAIAAVETRRMEKGEPSIITGEKSDKAEEES
ncbi:MAG: hypothetical protein PHQ35_05260 [Phycisphaerae bacterium]|nr:hypothetical protein [Phycisphaerae bacterium]MDD5380875.1 hypothetical protein [Phycisphaerae bacterium]